RPAPDPRLGAGIELFRRDARCLFDLGRIGEALAGERLPPEEPPPAFLEIEPARPGGDEDVVEAWMRGQPGVRLDAIMAGEIVGNHVEFPRWVGGLDVRE